ncbi:MAG: plasmid pRiA4b ORF-3 family protein [Solirubrobacteraceae bacterium]
MARVASEFQASRAGTAVLQLKLSLRGVSKPPVWRRLLVPSDMRLGQLHNVIQTAMGWTDTHLHAFSTPYGDYGPPDPELDHRDERTARLADFLLQPGDRIRYAYDFGDFWEHDIVLEKTLERDPDAQLPVCVAGKGGCPPEDCGGVWGYADLRATLADPASEEHSAMLEWLGLDSADEFDPAAFDMDETNDVLGMTSASRR